MSISIFKHVLVVAYYFPPMGLSGVQRVTKFVKYLPDHGWRATVLTVSLGGYFAYDDTLQGEVEDAGVQVVRTTSWDPTRLFSRGTTVVMPQETKRRRLTLLNEWFFVPDNKIGWLPHAIRAGLRLLRDRPFDAIFSSAPPYTAHLVSALLSRRSRLPLVLDYRDDWLNNPRRHYPTTLHLKTNAWLERFAMQSACSAITINEPIRESLQSRHPQTPVTVLPQGFDPADFAEVPEAETIGRMRFLYSGIFYDAQTPDFFLRALADFLAKTPDARPNVEAVFVGLMPAESQALVKQLGLSDVVKYEGYVDHRQAVAFQKSADVLWMTIGRRPGAEGISTSKLFEYFGARKPILALVPEGAARNALTSYGAAFIVEPDDLGGIEQTLATLFARWKAGTLPAPDDAYEQQFDRKRLAGVLAESLSSCLERA